jgi:pyruvate/2-oxoglutarate dehydrogenase complex dihydrolipoamide acyltransferase (E2) component
MPEEAGDLESEDDGEVNATDAARRKAGELGVNLSDVRGTGSGGRVLVKDVEKAAK